MAKLNTVGARLRDARERQEKTQLDIANHLGLSRAAVAQWESDTTSPSIFRVSEVAKYLEVTPEWIAYGISSEPQVKYLEPQDMGFSTVREIAYGESVTETVEVGKWGIPTEYSKGQLRATIPGALFICRVEGMNMAPAYEFGDKIIVDPEARRPSPGGVFLHWDGVGPALNTITVRPVGGKLMAHVSSLDEKTPSYEVEPGKLAIIGRVRAVIKAV